MQFVENFNKETLLLTWLYIDLFVSYAQPFPNCFMLLCHFFRHSN